MIKSEEDVFLSNILKQFEETVEVEKNYEYQFYLTESNFKLDTFFHNSKYN